MSVAWFGKYIHPHVITVFHTKLGVFNCAAMEYLRKRRETTWRDGLCFRISGTDSRIPIILHFSNIPTDAKIQNWWKSKIVKKGMYNKRLIYLIFLSFFGRFNCILEVVLAVDAKNYIWHFVFLWLMFRPPFCIKFC